MTKITILFIFIGTNQSQMAGLWQVAHMNKKTYVWWLVEIFYGLSVIYLFNGICLLN